MRIHATKHDKSKGYRHGSNAGNRWPRIAMRGKLVIDEEPKAIY